MSKSKIYYITIRPGLRASVRIVGKKIAYGHFLYLIEAIAGDGLAWVRESMLETE